MEFRFVEKYYSDFLAKQVVVILFLCLGLKAQGQNIKQPGAEVLLCSFLAV